MKRPTRWKQRLVADAFLFVCLSLPIAAADSRPAGLENVAVVQRLNESIPLDAPFHDERGHVVQLGDYFGRVPVVLSLNYSGCTMLCPLQLNDLLRAMRAMSIDAGRDFSILSVSIDPRDTPVEALEKRHEYVERYGRPGGETGWHFLTGDQEAIDRLSKAVGITFQQDPRSGQIAHIPVVVILTPDGRVARYFFGLEYSAGELQSALADAGKGRIAALVDALLFFCFHYDPAAGRYDVLLLRAVRTAGVLTVAALSLMTIVLFRRERRRRVLR